MTRYVVRLPGDAGETEWREAARALDRGLVPPAQVDWLDGSAGQDDLLAAPDPGLPAPVSPPRRVPRALMSLVSEVLMHADFGRFALSYRLLWRTRDEAGLAQIASDPDVARAEAMARSVRRDMHKMKAFVRFRETRDGDGAQRFIAWFEPDHHIVAATAPFFSRRFANMDWSILTPRLCAHWQRGELVFSPGVAKTDAPAQDRLEDVWRVYYSSIFNPARLKVKAMTAEMPKKYWRNLPEATLIDGLVRSARGRTGEMIAAPRLQPRCAQGNGPEMPMRPNSPDPDANAPPEPTLAAIARDLQSCRRCPLYRNATQAVPGEGPADARLMLVGEQPGDQEDLAGRPFVGPAGRVLDAALEEAGIDRSAVYATNTVKHFKHELRGKRRLHKRPNASEIDHCRWWLDLELKLVRPRLVVALGASAARGVLGRTVAVNASRGLPIESPDTPPVLVTVHPSYLLRIRDRDDAERERRRFVEDLQRAGAWVAKAA
ncbi:UdgX family uracil-DNA binding protein [Microbaculum marinum]|uniref:Type-4 uracil-DNA glycosylase n=1 Tax=Microbaculum marinum TaxID=1764581 RepID=A0AAW9RYF3_9HYPH